MINTLEIHKKPKDSLTNEEVAWILKEGWDSTSEVQESKIVDAIAMLPSKILQMLNSKEVNYATLLKNIKDETIDKKKDFLALVKYAFRVLGEGSLDVYYVMLVEIAKNRHILDKNGEDFNFTTIKQYQVDVLDFIKILNYLNTYCPSILNEAETVYNNKYSYSSEPEISLLQWFLTESNVDESKQVIASKKEEKEEKEEKTQAEASQQAKL